MKYRIQLIALLLFISGGAAAQEVTSHKVYFDFDQAVLTTTAKKTLDSIPATLKNAAKYTIAIDGYTDPSGTLKYNFVLANKRANTVKKYLVALGIDSTALQHVGEGHQPQRVTLSDAAKRNVTIQVGIEKQPNPKIETPTSTELSTKEKGGTIVTAWVQNPGGNPIKIKEFLSTKAMLKNNMYAIDVYGNILQTCGMIEICNTEKLDETGQFYTIMMPTRKGGFDPEMKVWVNQEDVNGQTRWTETTVSLTPDATGNYYVFKIPVGTKKCIKINLDKPCLPGGNCEVIYVSTATNYGFTDMKFNDESVLFSAKISATLFAFVKPSAVKIENLVFEGTYYNSEIGKEDVLQLHLNRCHESTYKTSFKSYHFCEKCVINKDFKGTYSKFLNRHYSLFQKIINWFKPNKKNAL